MAEQDKARRSLLPLLAKQRTTTPSVAEFHAVLNAMLRAEA